MQRRTVMLSALAASWLCCEGVGAEVSLSWQWSNPLPHGNNVYDMAFRDGIYWQVADRGQIYTSTDRVVWQSVPSGTTNALRGIAFRGEEILLCGESGTILRGSLAEGYRPETVSPATTDWLEAIAASETVGLAVGDNAAIYRSTIGTSWLRVGDLPFSDWLRGVAYGDGTFVAVGENGLIATSVDGESWEKRTNAVSTALNRVVFQNGAFFASGEAGILLRGSNQGIDWESVPTGKTNQLYSFVEGSSPAPLEDPMQLLAGDSALLLRTSPASGWGDQLGADSLLPAPDWSYYAALWDGARFLVAGRTGLVVESFRTNSIEGTLWFEEADSPRDWLWDVLALPGQYIAVGDRATVLTSRNGIAWSSEFVPTALTNSVFLGIGGSTNLVVAVGDHGSLMFSESSYTNVFITNNLVDIVDCAWQTNSVVQTSVMNLLGLVWKAVDTGFTNTLQGVCERDGFLVVVGDAGTVLTSTNGSSWASHTVPDEPDLSSVAAGPGGFVATGSDGAIYLSSNAASWERRESGTTRWIYRVRNLEGLLIAVGQEGTILTSADGSTWTPRSSRTTAWLTDITFSGGRYFVCGTQGTILSSTNAEDWAATPIITGKSLYGLASRPGQLLTVGVEGVILRALLDGYSDVQITGYAHAECESLTSDRLTLLGRPDQRFAIEGSPDMTNWERITELTFADTEAQYSLRRTNTPPARSEFFRTVPMGP